MIQRRESFQFKFCFYQGGVFYPNSFDSNLVYEKGGKLYLPLFEKSKHGNHIGFSGDEYWENHGYQSSYDLHKEARNFYLLKY